jgi:H+-transporting ATPase
MLGVFHQSLSETQTLVFLMLVFSGQTTVYVVRERGRFWSSLPGRTLLVASLCDLLVVSGLATLGILMAPVSPLLIGLTFALALVFMLLLDQVKLWVVRRPGPLWRAR